MPWWGNSKDDKAADKAQPSEPVFDAGKLPAREKLPSKLQELVNKADDDNSFFDDVKKG